MSPFRLTATKIELLAEIPCQFSAGITCDVQVTPSGLVIVLLLPTATNRFKKEAQHTKEHPPEPKGLVCCTQVMPSVDRTIFPGPVPGLESATKQVGLDATDLSVFDAMNGMV